ncbi:hypothetical protein AB0467_22005 [Streptomyces sp. NPDC052095]|uniref:hypothetical protein n=1 Tax=unclassified Streptomyces TaxID=2593676 RepID=UPI003450C1C1
MTGRPGASPRRRTTGVHFAFRRYDPWLAHGRPKAANVLFAVEATRRWSGEGITADAVMPGALRTGLHRRVEDAHASTSIPAHLLKTVEQGAAMSVLATASPPPAGAGGRSYADCARAGTLDRRGAPSRASPATPSTQANARRLWEPPPDLLATAG